MTLAEFKAWFNGFTESMESNPTEKQWERIKARVAEIDDKPVTYPVFVDRYLPYQSWPYLDPRIYWSSNGTAVKTYAAGDQMATAGGAASLQAYSNASQMKSASAFPRNTIGDVTIGKNEFNQFFNSASAMLDLGKAEYSSLAA